MRRTRNDIAENARAGVISIPSARLADVIDREPAFRGNVRNVPGIPLVTLHAMFDALQPRPAEHIDDLAERITALGGTAMGSAQAVSTATSLAPFPTDLVDGLRLVEALADRTAALTRSVRQGATRPPRSAMPARPSC